jgi:membrane-bound inhibitor of C-type lysozyme
VLREFEQHQWAADIESVARQMITVTQIRAGGQNILRSLIGRSEVADRIRSAFGEGFIDAAYIWDTNGDPAAI